jgi:hypothetical protein
MPSYSAQDQIGLIHVITWISNPHYNMEEQISHDLEDLARGATLERYSDCTVQESRILLSSKQEASRDLTRVNCLMCIGNPRERGGR